MGAEMYECHGLDDAKLHVREYITDKKKELERFLNDWSL